MKPSTKPKKIYSKFYCYYVDDLLVAFSQLDQFEKLCNVSISCIKS